MPVFPSLAWMEAYGDLLADHPRFGDLARALDGLYRFVVTPAGPLQHQHAYDLDVRPHEDGQAALRVQEASSSRPRLTLTADYERWRELITGRSDLMMAVLLRRLRVDGDLVGVRSSLADAKPLLDALRQVDTRWLET